MSSASGSSSISIGFPVPVEPESIGAYSAEKLLSNFCFYFCIHSSRNPRGSKLASLSRRSNIIAIT